MRVPPVFDPATGGTRTSAATRNYSLDQHTFNLEKSFFDRLLSIEARVPRDATLILYCASGNRSALAAVTLQEMGYEKVASMAGGFRDWVGTGGDVAD